MSPLPIARQETALVRSNDSARARVDRDIIYTAAGGSARALDVYRPAADGSTEPRPVLLALHGGGWRRFSKEGFGGAVAAEFVPRGQIVVAPNYQLSGPRRPSWPRVLDDLHAALRWIDENAEVFGFDRDRVAAIGESAGGHLAALLGTEPRSTSPDAPRIRVDAVIDLQGPADLFTLDEESRAGRAALRQLLGGPPRLLPEAARAASPALRVDRETAPMLMIHGTGDTIVPISQSRRLARALADAGVFHQTIEVPRAPHGFRFRWGDRDFAGVVAAFLEKVRGRPALG
ncbi:MAG: alpha/beta hydrolase [Isosphaeraceae bacterium]|nr:alpha/beta hydrolase [Isosphaeraceae bacterium]